jgi:hypothetical protein
MSGLKFLYNLILKDAAKGSGQASGILSIGSDVRKIAMNKYAKYLDSAKKQGVDLDNLSEQEIKYMLEMNKSKSPRVIPGDSPEGKGIMETLLGKRGEVVDLKNRKLDLEKPILGGTQETDEQILQRLKKQNEDSINRLKNKKEPEDMAGGGVAGLLGERPGYQNGNGVADEDAERAALGKRVRELMDDGYDIGEAVRKAMEEGYADGGPARQNFSMGKRAFLKLLGSGFAGIAGLKSGLLGFGKKSAVKKAVTETVKQSAGSGYPPPYFLNLVSKIKNLGDEAPRLATKDREKVTTYKDYTLTEDVTTGEQTIQRMKVLDDGSESYYGKPLTEETYMSYKPGKGQADETMKGKTPPDEYEQGTALLRNDKEFAGEVVDESATISDDVIKEGTVFEDTISEFGKADGGRIGYNVGKRVFGLMNLINKKFGKGTMKVGQTSKPIVEKTQLRRAITDFQNREKHKTLLDDFNKKYTVKDEIKISSEQVGSLDEFHADFVKETGINVPIDNLRQAWNIKKSYPFNTPIIDKNGKVLGGEATQKMYPKSKKFIVSDEDKLTKEINLKREGKLPSGERAGIDVPPMPAGFKLSREKLKKNYPELDEDMIDQIMELDKDMQGTVLTMLKNRRKDPDAYDKLLETKGDTLEFQKAFDKVTRRKNNADGGRIGYSGGGLLKLFKLLKRKPKKLETVKDFISKRKFLKSMVGETEKNKKARELKMLKEAAEKVRKNPDFKFKEVDIEKDIRPIFDLSKDRKLNASGGLANMLGE